jgi:hypothetical protein
MLRILLISLFLTPALHGGGIKTIHVFVSLCDNENQGIVPVPKKLGIGTDLINNLYWGAGYGVKSYFLKSPGWKLIKDVKNVNAEVLERCVFKKGNFYLCADAYKGIEIKKSIHDLLASMAGDTNDSMVIDSATTIGLYGKADVLAYVGHNGLMDFALDQNYTVKKNSSKKGVILLCCMSKRYFYDTIKLLNGDILLMTTGLLSPESYTLRSAIEAWMLHKKKVEIVNDAAQAYHQYQKCGINAAKRLFFAE